MTRQQVLINGYSNGYIMRYTKEYSNDKTDKKQIDGIYPFINYPLYIPLFSHLYTLPGVSLNRYPMDIHVPTKSGEWIPKWIPKGHNPRYNRGDVLIDN